MRTISTILAGTFILVACTPEKNSDENNLTSSEDQTQNESAAMTNATLDENGLRVASVYPVLKPNQREYVIPPSDAKLRIQNLVLPAGLTVRADPAITSIDWAVDTWEIGQNTSIDLSANQTKPGKPAKLATKGQAGTCTTGSAGSAGTDGTTGNSGPSLTIRDIRNLKNDGSLWIRTDSGPGGDGGDGQDGQQGGGPRRHGFHQCKAANGGGGGAGGRGGFGGLLTDVQILFSGPAKAVSSGEAPKCGRSTRPSGATGPTGVIAVYGGKGCSGAAGAKGADGKSG